MYYIKNPYQKYYSDSYADDANEQAHLKGIKIVQSQLSGIPFSPNRKVLDVACGVSTLGKTFGSQVYGIDINPEAVRIAEKNGIKAKLGDVEKKWNYPDKYFDIVIASHIIEHVIYPDHIILEAKRVLKKNGTIIIVTPNLASWFNRILLLFGFQPFLSEVSTVDKTLGLKFIGKYTNNRSPVGHLRIFTLPSLIDILTLYKFKIDRVSGVEFGSFPPAFGFVDRLFARIAPLASCIIVVGKNK